VAKDDNFQEMSRLAKELDTRAGAFLGQIHIINLQKLNAAVLQPKLDQLWQGRAKQQREGGLPPQLPVVVTDSRSNSLIIAANQEDFEVMAKLVSELEQQKLSPIAQIRTVRIEKNDPTKIADLLRKLYEGRA